MKKSYHTIITQLNCFDINANKIIGNVAREPSPIIPMHMCSQLPLIPQVPCGETSFLKLLVYLKRNHTNSPGSLGGPWEAFVSSEKPSLENIS